MAKQTINNGETGLQVRTKINDNFTELYNQVDGAHDFVFTDNTKGIKFVDQDGSGRVWRVGVNNGLVVATLIP